MKILVVEDNDDLRSLTTLILKKEGYEVLEAESVEDAKTVIVTAGMPDVILLDWMLPGISGLEFASQIHAKTYIIMVTALDSKDQIEAAFNAGVRDFIVKPAKAETLIERVQAAQNNINSQRDLLNRLDKLGIAIENVRTKLRF
jgi:two-component system phosphate regulon response regulator PhoB